MGCEKPVQVCREEWNKCVSFVSEAEIPPNRGQWQKYIAGLLERPGQALRIRISKELTYERIRSGIYKACRARGIAVRVEKVDELVYVRLIIQRQALGS